MTVGQFVFLLVINALVALVISVVVTLTLGRQPEIRQTQVATATTAPSASAAPARSSPTSPAATTYVIQAGDSLSGVAFRYGVTVEDLMRANGLSNPDVVYVGQRLVIPVPPAPSQTAQSPQGTTAAATGAPRTSVPVQPTATVPESPQVQIQQVRKAAAGSADEVVIVANSGAWVSLLGWSLVDAQGNAFMFPDLRLFPGGSVQVHTAAGRNTEVNLFWGINRPVWSEGGAVTLKDASGQVVQTYQVQ